MRDYSVTAKSAEAVCELISFEIRDQAFCVEVTSVREIRGWSAATPLPHAPDFVCGVINLRGSVLPIIDLAARLNYGKAEPSARHAIVVVQVADQIVGLLVDGVSEIITVEAKEIRPAPDFGGEFMHDMVQGILPLADRMITVLKLSGLLPTEIHQAA